MPLPQSGQTNRRPSGNRASLPAGNSSRSPPASPACSWACRPASVHPPARSQTPLHPQLPARVMATRSSNPAVDPAGFSGCVPTGANSTYPAQAPRGPRAPPPMAQMRRVKAAAEKCNARSAIGRRSHAFILPRAASLYHRFGTQSTLCAFSLLSWPSPASSFPPWLFRCTTPPAPSPAPSTNAGTAASSITAPSPSSTTSLSPPSASPATLLLALLALRGVAPALLVVTSLAGLAFALYLTPY